MSFAIRAVYKNRGLLPVSSNAVDDNSYFDPDEAQAIINTIKHFTTRSSHENIMSQAEMRDALRNSSINPDTNPMARDSVDAMLKDKEKRVLSRFEDPPVRDANAHGFSTGSTGKMSSGILGARMGRELERELDLVRSRSRAKMEAKRAEYKADAEEDDVTYIEDVEEDLGDVPDEVLQQIAKMKSRISNSTNVANAARRSAATEQAPGEASRDQRNLSQGYPSRASMVRGFVHRQGSQAGAVIHRTPMGAVDGF